MSARKYAREMVLVPKSEQQQGGGGGGQALPPPPPSPSDPIMQKTPDASMPPLYWQRQMLLDQLRTAPVVDQAIGILQDMKQNMGRPTQWPGAGTSEYFRLQNQLQDSLPPSQKVRPRENPRPRPPVGTWQPPESQPIYTTMGETSQALSQKYPDRLDDLVMPPQGSTVNQWSKAYDEAWKTVPVAEGVKYRVKPLSMPGQVANPSFQDHKLRAIRLVKAFNKERQDYLQHFQTASPEQKQTKLETINDMWREMNRHWREFQDYIHAARHQAATSNSEKAVARLSNSMLDALKAPVPTAPETEAGSAAYDMLWTKRGRQEGSGGTTYKRPRGWLQE